MKTILLIRSANMDTGTEGVILIDGEVFLSLELPWRDNEPSYSCIPEGSYLCKWWKSPSKGFCYRIYNVPDRDYILIHSATFAGDRKRGFLSDLRGCITLGKTRGTYKGQRGIFISKPSINRFNSILNKQDFILEIKNDSNYSSNS
jgi:hypothetical protein